MKRAMPCWTTRPSSSRCGWNVNVSDACLVVVIDDSASRAYGRPSSIMAWQGLRRYVKLEFYGQAPADWQSRIVPVTSPHDVAVWPPSCLVPHAHRLQFVIIDALCCPVSYTFEHLLWILRKAFIGFRAAAEQGFTRHAMVSVHGACSCCPVCARARGDAEPLGTQSSQYFCFRYHRLDFDSP